VGECGLLLIMSTQYRAEKYTKYREYSLAAAISFDCDM
jgi:hypothetical protein